MKKGPWNKLRLRENVENNEKGSDVQQRNRKEEATLEDSVLMLTLLQYIRIAFLMLRNSLKQAKYLVLLLRPLHILLSLKHLVQDINQ